MPSDRLRLRDVRNTSTFRLTVLLGTVFALGVAALIGLIYLLSAHELTVRTDHILRLQADRLLHTDAGALPARVHAEMAQGTGGINYFALQSRDGETIAGNIAVPADFPLDRPVNTTARPHADQPLRILVEPMPTGELLVIARDISPIVDLRHRVLVVLIASGFAIALLVLAAGTLLSRQPLRRIAELQRVSREIAMGRLDRRMPLSGRGDELDLFAGTVNAMVEEVARVVGQVKEVTDAIAHDLRTPLTHVRARLHQARHLPDADPRTVALAAGAIADLDTVLDRFAALLRISELEARGRQAEFRGVVLAPLLAEVAELFEPLAEARGIALAAGAADEAEVRGDRRLLFEVISNLVDNAIKFVPEGGAIAMEVEMLADATVIEVRDNGPGVPAAEREAVLRRFHRGTNAGEAAGSGLGLSVVAAIVHLHGFALVLDDAAPGLVVRILCPREPAAPPR